MGEFPRRLETLGGKPDGGSLEHGPDLDGVEDLLRRERPDAKTAGETRVEQALVGQPLEREAHRRPRRAQQRNQPQFRQPLARPELAVEDTLPELENQAVDLALGAPSARTHTCVL